MILIASLLFTNNIVLARFANDFFNPVTLSYNIKGVSTGLSYLTKSQLQLQIKQQNYQLNFHHKVFGIYSKQQSSQGEITNTGLKPFIYKENSKKFANFNYAHQKIIFSSTNLPPHNLTENAQDRISAFFQVGFLLSQQPDLPINSKFQLQISSTIFAPTWTFTLIDKPTIMVLDKAVNTLLITKTHSSDDKNEQLKVWLAPEFNYIPVKVEYKKSNLDKFVQIITKIN